MSSDDNATPKESPAPRRRKQSASGAVDRLTNVMGRDKPQNPEEETTATEEAAVQAEEQPAAPDASNSQPREEEIEVPAEQVSASGKSTKAPDDSSSTKKNRIRASVDLSRDQHKFLKMFAVQNDSDGMSVLRELVEMLEEEEDIAPRLLQRLGEKG